MDQKLHVPYLSLAIYSICLICEIISIFDWFAVLRSIYRLNRQPNHTQMSPFFIIYSLNCLFENVFSLLYCLYMVVMWRPENIYNTNIVIWLFISCLIFMSILQVSLFFLTIERALIINFPYSYSKFHQIKLLYLMIFSMVVSSGINVGFHLADFYAFPKNDSLLYDCWSAGCLVTARASNAYNFQKFGLAFLNIIGSIYFFYSLKVFNKKYNFSTGNFIEKRKINNLLIAYTIVIDFTFNFLPYLSIFTITSVTGIHIIEYLGPFAIILTACDTLIASFVFVSKMKKLEKEHSIPNVMVKEKGKISKSNQIHPMKS